MRLSVGAAGAIQEVASLGFPTVLVELLLQWAYRLALYRPFVSQKIRIKVV